MLLSETVATVTGSGMYSDVVQIAKNNLRLWFIRMKLNWGNIK